MKTLSLLRHAKSSWEEDSLDDHDRPLNVRGRKSAPEIGRWILKREKLPQLILSSTAVRACDTVILAFPEKVRPPVEYDRGLYLANVDALLERLRALPDDVTCAMLVGHNPGLSDLALSLARPNPGNSEAKLRRALEKKLPTAGLVILELPVETWRAVTPEAGKLTLFVSPKDL